MVEYKKRSVTKSMKENTPAFMLISQYKNAKVLRDYIEEQMDKEHMKLKKIQDQLNDVNDRMPFQLQHLFLRLEFTFRRLQFCIF